LPEQFACKSIPSAVPTPPAIPGETGEALADERRKGAARAMQMQERNARPHRLWEPLHLIGRPYFKFFAKSTTWDANF
jgi:hypothetical protein